MEEKLNFNAVIQYSEKFAEKITSKAFNKQNSISGKQILELCSIKQINLFILRELFQAWRQEIKKMKSPFFDFENTEVKEALTNYQNILSRHIAVSKKDLQPLVIKATSQTLFLIMDPYDFYSELLDRRNGSGLTLKELESEIKYIQINKPPLENLVQTMKQKNLASIKGSEAFAILDHILEEVNFSPDDVDTYVKSFSEIESLTIEMLYIKKQQEKKPVQKTLLTEVAQPTGPTINEKLAGATKSSLAEDLDRIEKIREKLTINQKFMFTKILFEGDFDVFSRTIDFVDECNSYDQALSYLNKSFPGWNREGEEYEEFIQLVEKRFN